MNVQSLYLIPCLCGAEVRSHERETTCERCGRVLVVVREIDGLDSRSTEGGS